MCTSIEELMDIYNYKQTMVVIMVIIKEIRNFCVVIIGRVGASHRRRNDELGILESF
jgi:hypothetical protein